MIIAVYKKILHNFVKTIVYIVGYRNVNPTYYGLPRFFGKPSNLKIDKGTTINPGVLINHRSKVEIGKNCHISSNVQIHTSILNINKQPFSHISKEIIINDNVWIASGVVISGGVEIGKGSVIGANSVVLKDIPEKEFWAGSPAVFIKKLNY